MLLVPFAKNSARRRDVFQLTQPPPTHKDRKTKRHNVTNKRTTQSHKTRNQGKSSNRFAKTAKPIQSKPKERRRLAKCLSVKFLLRILYLKYFIPAQGFASTRQKNATPFTYLTSPSFPYPPFASYFSFLFRDEGLSYHAFAAVAVCQFSFLLGILHIFPISFCCYGVLLYFSYII